MPELNDFMVFLVGVSFAALAYLTSRVFRPRKPSAARQKTVARECRNCKHFNLEEGQGALKQHPAFLMAGQTLSPAKMTVRVTGHDDHGEPIYSEPDYPARATWAEFGACLNPKNAPAHLKWHEHGCDNFEPKEDA